jgi:hypothetical protein
MLGKLARAEAVAPVLDPTAFMQHGDKMREDKSVIAILAQAARELNKFN